MGLYSDASGALPGPYPLTCPRWETLSLSHTQPVLMRSAPAHSVKHPEGAPQGWAGPRRSPMAETVQSPRGGGVRNGVYGPINVHEKKRHCCHGDQMIVLDWPRGARIVVVGTETESLLPYFPLETQRDFHTPSWGTGSPLHGGQSGSVHGDGSDVGGLGQSVLDHLRRYQLKSN